jgi:type IV pilus assembly protein PilB
MQAAQALERRLVNDLVLTRHLDPARADQMLRESELTGLPMPEILLANDVLSEEDLARQYAEHAGLRYADLARRDIPEPWVLSIPENLARRACCLPLGEVSGQLVMTVADPVDISVRAAVQAHLSRQITWVVSPRYQIRDWHNRIYGEARDRGSRQAEMPTAVPKTVSTVTGLNAVELLDSVLDEAVDRRASDVHLEPTEDRIRVRIRIDGRLVESRVIPKEMLAPVVSRIKVLSKMDITERRAAQDGRFDYRSFEQRIDVRVATIPTVYGERVTLRLLGMDRSRLDLSSLGMELDIQQQFERLIRRPYGIILITGPTGSGKTTTLYASLRQINTLDKHIITVENPVEYRIAGVNQVQVDPEFEVTFANALRSIVRHDPDIIMVGEIRDLETAHLALEASLTGHLVFATLHTNSAPGAMTRLLDMGCEPYLVASGVIGVVAQRLVRRICDQCKSAYTPNATERELCGIPPERVDAELYRGKGCARCLRTGYYDRVGIYEYMQIDGRMAELIMEKATAEQMQQHGMAHGMQTLRMDAIAKTLRGLTTLEEALRVTTADTL